RSPRPPPPPRPVWPSPDLESPPAPGPRGALQGRIPSVHRRSWQAIPVLSCFPSVAVDSEKVSHYGRVFTAWHEHRAARAAKPRSRDKRRPFYPQTEKIPAANTQL